MLSTEGAYEFILLELTSVSIDESCPLIHLVTSLLIKFILVVVIFLLEFLRELPDDIVLKLEKFSLLFVVFKENASLS